MKTQRGFFRNPTAVVLVLVTVVALVLAGLIGAELYTRHTADAKVTNAVQCEVQDSASVSFAVTPRCCGSTSPAITPTSPCRPRQSGPQRQGHEDQPRHPRRAAGQLRQLQGTIGRSTAPSPGHRKASRSPSRMPSRCWAAW
ncbi:hypothetical protein I553_2073 [Mycobacterium xenopi 4042]|uniref:Uncharacterized protein n=1 Tax=Mycobacterium xenopi 4042 TaxID=1299334 RepID=X8DN46_MYCXE|nr:hypothetical protein I553_2073 [Mycobacterium xenopi 4042]